MDFLSQSSVNFREPEITREEQSLMPAVLLNRQVQQKHKESKSSPADEDGWMDGTYK